MALGRINQHFMFKHIGHNVCIEHFWLLYILIQWYHTGLKDKQLIKADRLIDKGIDHTANQFQPGIVPTSLLQG